MVFCARRKSIGCRTRLATGCIASAMALVAVTYFPAHADLLLPLVIGATVLFELIGPVFTRMALNRAESKSG